MRQHPRAFGAAFTLAEAIVVIVITILLASLLLPGVMNQRRTPRRTDCSRRLRNIALAMAMYSETHQGRMPASGIWEADSNGDGFATDVELTAAWRFADPDTEVRQTNSRSSPAGMKYSWVVLLLPYLDQQKIYDEWDFSAASGLGDFRSDHVDDQHARRSNSELSKTNIRLLTCPEDISTVPSRGNLSYVVNGGFSYHFYVTNEGTALVADAAGERQRENLRRMGVSFLSTLSQSGARRSMARDEIVDGLGSTVLFSENINAGNAPEGSVAGMPQTYYSNWASPHPNNTSFLVNGVAVGVFEPPGRPYNYSLANSPGFKNAPRAGVNGSAGIGGGGINDNTSCVDDGNFPYPNSHHSGGVYVAMCDGSIRFLSEKTPGRIWAAIVTPAGSAVVNPTNGQSEYSDAHGQRGFTEPSQPNDDDF